MLRPVVEEDVLGVATLLTSELATNSVLHAGSAVDVEVTVGDAEVRVVVSDSDPATPRVGACDLRSTFGRGMALVDRLSDGWGVAPRPPGKGVWFSLSR